MLVLVQTLTAEHPYTLRQIGQKDWLEARQIDQTGLLPLVSPKNTGGSARAIFCVKLRFKAGVCA